MTASTRCMKTCLTGRNGALSGAREDKGITIYNSATLIGDVEIGEHTWIGPFTLLDGGGGLEIGRYCSISTGCQVLTHDTVRWALSGGKTGPERAATKIGDCCFLGSHAIVTRGVTIGNHCLIAAGAVVKETWMILPSPAGCRPV